MSTHPPPCRRARPARPWRPAGCSRRVPLPVPMLARQFGLCLGLCLALNACQQREVSVPAVATPVGSARVSAGPGQPALHVHGLIAHRDELRLAFKVGGVIARLNVDAGNSVRAGQVLAEIDPAEIDAQVAQARELDSKAARDLQRGERLFADEVLSLEQVQNLRTQRALTAAALRSAHFNRQYARILAPSDGVILYRLAQAHELIAPGQAVLVLGSGARGFVLRAAVSCSSSRSATAGLGASVQLDAAPGQVLLGHISQLSRAADPATGLFPIEIALEPTPVHLASGLVASATVQPSAAGTLAYMPAGALVTADGTRGTVFVLEEGRARRRAVTIAFIEGEQIALRAGLQAGETVITDGAPFLDDAERVTVAGH